ncbi:MAG: NlpC/P60 family protein [Rhodobacteraceae bacterium]|nr:NlpC/P60 family protein [Paracoccaceae bacterium]
MRNDPRLVAATDTVAAMELKGQVAARWFSNGMEMQCATADADMVERPEGSVACQLLHGWPFRVLEIRKGWAFGCSGMDGYVGHVKATALGEPQPITHWITVAGSHRYLLPDLKSRPTTRLPFGALISVDSIGKDFFRLNDGGYVPTNHANEVSEHLSDHVEVAESFVGSPYLWGGNSHAGIDCSGLVQMAVTATGHPCPRDSDMQEAELGCSVSKRDRRRGDLVFWHGHVGILADRDTLLHATAHFMSVVCEPLEVACARIREGGVARFQGFRRLGHC